MACKYQEMVEDARGDCYYPDAENMNNAETKVMCKFCIYYEPDED